MHGQTAIVPALGPSSPASDRTLVWREGLVPFTVPWSEVGLVEPVVLCFVAPVALLSTYLLPRYPPLHL